MHDAKDFKLFHATQITCKTSIVLWLWIPSEMMLVDAMKID